MNRMGKNYWCFACRCWVQNYREHAVTVKHLESMGLAINRMKGER